MRIGLMCIAVVGALCVSACSERSTDSNPTAFCSAYKKVNVAIQLQHQQAGQLPKPTNAKAAASELAPILQKEKEIAAAYQKVAGVAPTDIESAVQTRADFASYESRATARAFAAMRNPSSFDVALEKQKLDAAREKDSAAADQIATWTDAYCKY